MKRFLKIGCLGIIVVFVLLLLLGLFLSDKTKDNQDTNESKTELKGKEKVEKPNIKNTEDVNTPSKIGEELQVGNVTFVVNDTSTTEEIKDAKGYISYKPEADESIFLIVNVTVKNVGKEAITTDSSFFKLIDGELEYSPSTIFTTDSKFFLYDGINPNLSKSGNVLFEIPKGEHDLKLNVQTGFWGTEQGQINLN